MRHHPDRRTILLAALVAAGTLAVHARSLLDPSLRLDDFVILEQSIRWTDAWVNLWVPVNEHCWPVFRLATAVVTWAAGGAAALPLACALAVRVWLLATVWLVYLFVRRERGHPFYGWLAATGFGVTAVYQEAVYWYAASPAVGAAAFTMLALLAAQRGDRIGLSGAGLWSALAPGWYGGGVLTGPLCAAYLVGRGRPWSAVIPLIGSMAFVAAALAMSGDKLLHADHHGSRSTAEALDPVVGLIYTGRSVVDNLLLGAIGVAGVTCPSLIVVVLLIAVLTIVVRWWLSAPRRDLVVLGVAFVVLHYGLVYAARAAWPYDPVLRSWSRYNLFPWMGVVFAVVGGLGRRGDVAGGAPLTHRQTRVLAWVTVGLALTNLPRGILGTPVPDVRQREVLQAADEIDHRCRAAGLPADAARRVLTPIGVPGDLGFDVYRLLRSGDGPSDLSDDEVRRRLGIG